MHPPQKVPWGILSAGLVALTIKLDDYNSWEDDLCIKGVWLVDQAGKRHKGQLFEECDHPSFVVWAGLAPGSYTLLPPQFQPYSAVVEPVPNVVVVPESGGLVNAGECQITVGRPDPIEGVFAELTWTSVRRPELGDDGVWAARCYVRRYEGRPWAVWLEPWLEAWQAGKAAEHAERAAEGQRILDEEEAAWAARPLVIFDDLLDTLGKSSDHPAVLEVRDRKKNIAAADSLWWDYEEGYSLYHAGGIIDQINIHKPIPGWNPGTTSLPSFCSSARLRPSPSSSSSGSPAPTPSQSESMPSPHGSLAPG